MLISASYQFRILLILIWTKSLQNNLDHQQTRSQPRLSLASTVLQLYIQTNLGGGGELSNQLSIVEGILENQKKPWFGQFEWGEGGEASRLLWNYHYIGNLLRKYGKNVKNVSFWHFQHRTLCIWQLHSAYLVRNRTRNPKNKK